MTKQCYDLVSLDWQRHLIDSREVSEFHRHTLQLDWICTVLHCSNTPKCVSYTIFNRCLLFWIKRGFFLTFIFAAAIKAETAALWYTVVVCEDTLEVKVDEEPERSLKNQTYPSTSIWSGEIFCISLIKRFDDYDCERKIGQPEKVLDPIVGHFVEGWLG